ncbi:MAG: hypothetical protein EKK55_19245 [Rhodocyclaceae bacterium]|nr:MAG: hypothetical protein EKK55_19245 [Rhodocyclaceae bacterium]
MIPNVDDLNRQWYVVRDAKDRDTDAGPPPVQVQSYGPMGPQIWHGWHPEAGPFNTEQEAVDDLAKRGWTDNGKGWWHPPVAESTDIVFVRRYASWRHEQTGWSQGSAWAVQINDEVVGSIWTNKSGRLAGSSSVINEEWGVTDLDSLVKDLAGRARPCGDSAHRERVRAMEVTKNAVALLDYLATAQWTRAEGRVLAEWDKRKAKVIGLPMADALARLRASYADHIAAGGSVEPCVGGDAICVDGGGMRGAVLYNVPLMPDDKGHWSV